MIGLQTLTFGTSPELVELPFYRRFFKWPSIVAFSLLTSWALAVSILLFIKLNGFWGGLLFVPVTALVWFVAMVGRSMLRMLLARKLMARWVRGKFDSWTEFSEWMTLVPFYRLNSLAETPDEDWLPTKGGGSYLIKAEPVKL